MTNESRQIPVLPVLSGRRAALVACFFLLGVFGTGMFDAASYLLFPEHEWELPKGTVGRRISGIGLRGGAPMRMVESRVEEVSRAASYLRPFWAETLYRGLRHTAPAVVAGDDGWLFLARTLKPLRRPEEAVEFCAAWVSATELAMRAHGVRTTVAVVPSKVTVYPQFLPPGIQAPNGLYLDLVEALRGHGVQTVELQALLQEEREAPVFRRDDTHWTMYGAWLTAKEIALQARGHGLELEPHVDAKVRWLDRNYSNGDLTHMAGFTPGGRLCRELSVNEVRPFVHSFGDDDEEAERIAPVVLAGDSFAVTGTLAPYLTKTLGAHVKDFSGNGAGLPGGMREAWDAGAFEDASLLVWVFVERQLGEAVDTSYSSLCHVIGEIYENQYRDVFDVSEWHAARDRSRAPLTGCVLPGNGTTAVRLDTHFEVSRRAGAKGFVARTEPRSFIVRRIPEDGATTYLPIVHTGFLTGTTISLFGGPVREGEFLGAMLCTAYQAARPIERSEVRVAPGIELDGTTLRAPTASGELRFAVALEEALPLDGSNAIGFRLELPRGTQSEEQAGSGRIVDGLTGRVLCGPFPVHATGLPVTYVLPLNCGAQVKGCEGASALNIELSGVRGAATLTNLSVMEL